MSQIGNVGCFESANFIFLRLVMKLEVEFWVSSENKKLDWLPLKPNLVKTHSRCDHFLKVLWVEREPWLGL